MDSKASKTLFRSLAVACLGVSSIANAVEPRFYQLGDTGSVAPHVKLEFGNDNNPLRATDGSQEAMFLRVQPSVRYLAQQRNNQLQLSYQGDYYQYFEEYCQGQPGLVRPGDCLSGSPTFNKASYQDHTFALNGFLEISSRIRAILTASQVVDNQPLGTGQSSSLGVLNSLTATEAWNRTTARAEIGYGAEKARGEVRAGLTLGKREFNSERDLDFDNLSESSVAPDVRLLYRVGTRTQLFAGLGASQVRGGDSERDISRQLFGVEFDTSAITSGAIGFSNVTERFVRDRRDLQYIGWDVELTWRPRRYSTLTVGGSRKTERGLFDDDIGLSTELDGEWVHFWRERFSTRTELGVEFNEDVDQFSEFSGTKNTSYSLRIEGNYNIRRWLDIGGFIVIDSRQGKGTALDGAATSDYGRTLIGITANGTI